MTRSVQARSFTRSAIAFSSEQRCRDGRGLSSSGPDLRHFQLRRHPLPHDELLHLARHRHRELVDEANMPWHLVVRDLVLAEFAHRLGRQRLAGAYLDPGAEFLAIALVRDAEYLHVLD